MFGDEWYLAPVDSYLHMRLSHEEVSPTFVYLFTHKTTYSHSAFFRGDPDTFYGISIDFKTILSELNKVSMNSGVSHGDELIYLFDLRSFLAPKTLPNEDEEQMRQAMIEMWVNFARNG